MKRPLLLLLCAVVLAGCIGRASAAPAPEVRDTATRLPGRLAYERERHLFLLDGATGREVDLGPGGGATWSHDGQWLAFEGGDAALHMARPDGSGLIAFVRAEAREAAGNSAGWMETRTLWVSKPDGTEARHLQNAGAGISSPTWMSPTQLLYARGASLWAIGTDGGAPREVAKIDPPGPGYYGQVSVP